MFSILDFPETTPAQVEEAVKKGLLHPASAAKWFRSYRPAPTRWTPFSKTRKRVRYARAYSASWRTVLGIIFRSLFLRRRQLPPPPEMGKKALRPGAYFSS